MKNRGGRAMSGVSRQLLLMARSAGVDLRQASLVMHNVCTNLSAHLGMLERWGYLTSRKVPGQLKRYFLADDAAKADAWVAAMAAQAAQGVEPPQPVLAGRRGAVPPPWQGATFSGLGIGRYLAPGAEA